MNKIIKIMIELQRLFQEAMAFDAESSRSSESIELWKRKLAEAENNFALSREKLKNSRSSVKQGELNLEVVDEKLKMLKQRREGLSNQKELDATDREISGYSAEKDEIETLLIDFIDVQEKFEKENSVLSAEMDEMRLSVDNDVEKLTEKILICGGNRKNKDEKFNEIIPLLDVQYRDRFMKLLKSKKGLAVSAIDVNLCTGCNFTIPPFLAKEVSEESKISLCSNCGRYIYRQI